MDERSRLLRCLFVAMIACALSGCQPKGLTIRNETNRVVDIVEITKGDKTVDGLLPGGQLQTGLPADDDDGCVSWMHFQAIDAEGTVVSELVSPCPGDWSIEDS